MDDETLAFAHQMFDLARSGDSHALARYVDAGLPADLTNSAGDTLLILAAYHDHPETVAALLARGADTTRVNDRGQTALAAAVIRRSDAVELLLAAGADPANGSPSPIEVAEFFDLPDMLTRLTDAAAEAPGGAGVPNRGFASERRDSDTVPE
ncbi:hypothetical protein BH20ACT4_BH20ACT4_03460 [soil metagenome]